MHEEVARIGAGDPSMQTPINARYFLTEECEDQLNFEIDLMRRDERLALRFEGYPQLTMHA